MTAVMLTQYCFDQGIKSITVKCVEGDALALVNVEGTNYNLYSTLLGIAYNEPNNKVRKMLQNKRIH